MAYFSNKYFIETYFPRYFTLVLLTETPTRENHGGTGSGEPLTKWRDPWLFLNQIDVVDDAANNEFLMLIAKTLTEVDLWEV